MKQRYGMVLILFSVLFAFFTFSCAGSKESLIVKENPGPGGNSENNGISEASGSTDSKSDLRERLQVPELYECSCQSEDGIFHLNCKAEIELPDVTQIPVYEVSQGTVDQEWIDCVTEAFFGDCPIYDGASYLPDPQIYGRDVENLMEKKEVHPHLEDPENPSPSPGYYSGYFYGIVEMEGELFSYKLERQSGNGLQINILRKKPEALNEVLYWDSGYYASEETTSYGRPSREEAEQIAGITPEQARETAEEYLNRLELHEFSPRYICLSTCWYWPENSYGLADSRYIDAGYLVSCTREVEGIPVTDEAQIGYWGETDRDDLGKWWYEKVEFFVNREGLQEARINHLYRMGEQQAENAELLDFPEIADIFEQAIQMQHEKTDALRVEITIDRVQLGYMRIYNPGVDITSGLLIPVWDFFGSREYEGENGTTKRAEPNESILTINASDGTVIDRRLGY